MNYMVRIERKGVETKIPVDSINFNPFRDGDFFRRLQYRGVDIPLIGNIGMKEVRHGVGYAAFIATGIGLGLLIGPSINY
jgi:hypothetical protein